MFLYRKIADYLLKWKEGPYHKPLIIKGATEIGPLQTNRSYFSNKTKQKRKSVTFTSLKEMYVCDSMR